MDIGFVQRSGFLVSCEDAIRNDRVNLDNCGIVRVEFEAGGYSGHVVVSIRAEDPKYFASDWQGTDETRFPARIKAAATALYNCGCFGRYGITHKDGSLEIARA